MMQVEIAGNILHRLTKHSPYHASYRAIVEVTKARDATLEAQNPVAAGVNMISCSASVPEQGKDLGIGEVRRSGPRIDPDAAAQAVAGLVLGGDVAYRGCPNIEGQIDVAA